MQRASRLQQPAPLPLPQLPPLRPAPAAAGPEAAAARPPQACQHLQNVPPLLLPLLLLVMVMLLVLLLVLVLVLTLALVLALALALVPLQHQPLQPLQPLQHCGPSLLQAAAPPGSSRRSSCCCCPPGPVPAGGSC
jgi:hypothetical protein